MFSTKNEITFLLFTAPAITTLVCAFILIVFFRGSKSKKALASLLTVVGVCMIAYCISDYYIFDEPYTINRFFDSWSGLLISPFLLYYFSCLIRPGDKHGRLLLCWLIPAIVSMPLYFLIAGVFGEYPDTCNWSSFLRVIFKPEPMMRLLTLLFFASEIVLFAVKIFAMARKHQVLIRNNFSYIENINLQWVYNICWLMMIFGALAILGIVTPDFEYKVLFSFATFFLMLLIFIYGTKQKDILYAELEMPKEQPDDPGGANTKGNVTRDRIISYFEKEKPYLDDELTLVSLADAIKINRTYISNTINNDFGTTFYGFVNRYRLVNVMRLMEGGDITLSTAIYESGFKSKSVFYKLFREQYGCTPTEYFSQK